MKSDNAEIAAAGGVMIGCGLLVLAAKLSVLAAAVYVVVLVLRACGVIS